MTRSPCFPTLSTVRLTDVGLEKLGKYISNFLKVPNLIVRDRRWRRRFMRLDKMNGVPAICLSVTAVQGRIV
jgi:hypothetical protein